MIHVYIWSVILVAICLAGFGIALNRRNYPSGMLMTIVGLMVIFFTLGLVARVYV